MNNKSGIEKCVIQAMDRLEIVNKALLKAGSDSDVESAMLTFSGFALHV